METGEKREFPSTYAFAQEMKTSPQNVVFALQRCGTCAGWKLYDTPDELRKRIEELQRQLEEVER
jgi:hypothetical protein